MAHRQKPLWRRVPPNAPKPTNPSKKRKKRLNSKRSQYLNKTKCIEFDDEEIPPYKLATLKAASSQEPASRSQSQSQSQSPSQSLSQCTESDNLERLNIATMHAHLNLENSQDQNDNENEPISTNDNSQFDDCDYDSPDMPEAPLRERIKAKRQTKNLTIEKVTANRGGKAKRQRKNLTKEKARSKSRRPIMNAANQTQSASNHKIPKHKRTIIFLGTRTKHNTTDDKDKKEMIEAFCNDINFKVKQYKYNHWIGYIVVDKVIVLSNHLQNHANEQKLVTWLKHRFQGKVDQTGAYHIEQCKEFTTPIKNMHKKSNRQGKLTFKNKSEIETLNKMLTEDNALKSLTAEYDIEMFGLIVTSQTILSLMFQEKKMFEYRPLTYSTHLPYTKEHKTTLSRLKGPPRTPTKSKARKAPDRGDIKGKKRQRAKKFPPRITEILLSEYNVEGINLHHQIMNDFNYKKIKAIFVSWIYQKNIGTKNKNKTIHQHNERILAFFEYCFKAVQYWGRVLWSEKRYKDYVLIQNFFVIMFCIPHKMNLLISNLKTEYTHLYAILYTIIGWCDYHCKFCKHPSLSSIYHPNYDPKWEFKCRNPECKKNKYNFRWNVPESHPLKQTMRQTHLHEYLEVWQGISEYTLRKQGVAGQKYSEGQYTNIRKHLWETLAIYNQHHHLILGSSSDHIYLDHTWKGLKRKFKRGYLKSQKKCHFSAIDDDSVFVLVPVYSERILETNYYIVKYTEDNTHIDTDCGKAFNDIIKLGHRTHRKVNHSGEKCSDGLIHFFYNIDTAACINSVEGNHGRFQQLAISKNPSYCKTEWKMECLIADYDFRYNRTENILPQLIINYFLAYSVVYPLKAAALERIERPNFDNIFEVEEILDKRKSLERKDEYEYLLYWKGYAIYRSSWHHAGNLNCPVLIEEYDGLPEQDKIKRRNKYINSVERRAKRDQTSHCIPFLTLDKVHNHCQVTTKQRAMNDCILKDKVLSTVIENVSEDDGTVFNILSALIEGKTENGDDTYEVEIKFRDGCPVEWECTCPRFEQLRGDGRGITPCMCKHMYASILRASEEGHTKIKNARIKACKKR